MKLYLKLNIHTIDKKRIIIIVVICIKHRKISGNMNIVNISKNIIIKDA